MDDEPVGTVVVGDDRVDVGLALGVVGVTDPAVGVASGAGSATTSGSLHPATTSNARPASSSRPVLMAAG